VSIDVQREARSGVSHEVLHTFDVRTAGNHHCGRRVAQIMHTGIRASDACSNLLKIFVEGMNGKMRTHFIGKDKVVTVVPELTGFELILCLSPLFIAEIFKAERGRLNRARLAALGSVGDIIISAVLFLLTLELLTDGDTAFIKINL